MTVTQREQPRPGPFHPVLVRDVMTSPAVTVEPAATVKDIAEILVAHDFHSVPVVDLGDQLVGIVSEADLISREGYPTKYRRLAELVEQARVEHRHHWGARALGVTASEIMTREVITCRPAESVAVIARRMLSREVPALPVVEDGHVVGIVSRHDLLTLLDRPDPEIREKVEQLLADPLLAPEQHTVTAEVRDGVVVLTGSVLYPSDVPVLAALVSQLPGVTSITNLVKAREPEPHVPYLRDTDWR
ncbi:MAG TPA: CBS domain-containing protein [Acidimicrobiales bacterium]|nr:CBS domain-containing protein [Acidimicrobiales bacterium]